MRSLLSSREAQLAPFVVLVLAATYAASRSGTSGGVTRSQSIALSVFAVVPLMIGRRWPAFAAATATLLTVVILHAQDAPLAFASYCVTLFLLAQLVVRRGLLQSATLLIPMVVLAAVRVDDDHNVLASTTPLLLAVAALIVGESMRRRGLAVAALGASEEAMTESIRTQTAMEERARIARELHDIVAHHLSVIAVESEAARLTSPALSSEAGSRFEAIASTAREALTETRRLLGVLREDTGGEAARAPQPGLGELDDLIDRAQATGTPIRLVRQGQLARLPMSVDLAAYRIVQEALTNARRHAAGAPVDVEVTYREQALHLRVRDYGPCVLDAQPVEGHGLMGMRERTALAGGTFSSGPAEGGGFEVEATLPVNGTTP